MVAKGGLAVTRQKPSDDGDEPKVTEAALCTNVRSSDCGQERDKIKPSFAKGFGPTLVLKPVWR